MLASCLLCEPAIQGFFHSLLLGNRTPVNDSVLRKRYGLDFWSFRETIFSKPMSSDKDAKDTWKALNKLKAYVQWSFTSEPSYGLTQPVPYLPRTGPDHGSRKGSRVRISEQYIHAIRFGGNEVKNWPFAESHDANASLLRTYFHLAVTLLHELCHAMFVSVNPPKFDGSRFLIVDDTFYRDQQIAELCYAWESVMLGGTIDPLSNHGLCICAPYGFKLARFPGASNDLDAHSITTKASPAVWGLEHRTQYLVHMSYVHQFFTNEFWQKKVAMNTGLDVFHAPRIYGVQIPASRKLLPDETWNDVMQQPMPQSPPPPRTRFS